VAASPFGVAETESDVGDVPITFDAVTTKVYSVPLFSPVNVQELVVEMQLAPPGDAVTV